ncbi:hypothetical protein SAMN05216215_107522 [Saccharopolyspora shandongensis]|uniref:Secreted protein n=2 Tax=Saccharopolyspora shandongensis TaxID=418495 RepID=A0A1H3T5J9_9PSEU|nr:hypothetical protein SAMN05216215_107522 [Saccharopolyspora shandongensis]
MKMRRSLFAAGLTLGAAVVAMPLTIGAASASGWETVGGGPAVYSSMDQCNEEAAQLKADGTYKDARCYIGDRGWIFLEVLS